MRIDALSTRGARRAFLKAAAADLVACQTLAGLGLSEGIWLLNLPATVTVGRIGWFAGGEAAGLAATVAAGAALYGWAGARLQRERETGRAETTGFY